MLKNKYNDNYILSTRQVDQWYYGTRNLGKERRWSESCHQIVVNNKINIRVINAVIAKQGNHITDKLFLVKNLEKQSLFRKPRLLLPPP